MTKDEAAGSGGTRADHVVGGEAPGGRGQLAAQPLATLVQRGGTAAETRGELADRRFALGHVAKQDEVEVVEPRPRDGDDAMDELAMLERGGTGMRDGLGQATLLGDLSRASLPARPAAHDAPRLLPRDHAQEGTKGTTIGVVAAESTTVIVEQPAPNLLGQLAGVIVGVGASGDLPRDADDMRMVVVAKAAQGGRAAGQGVLDGGGVQV